MGAIVKGIESALVAEGRGGSLVMPPRQNLTLGNSFLRVMPVIMGGAGVFGLKMFQGSLERGVRYLVLLCDIESADVLAVLDGAYLTAVRTGATSALATSYMARPDATTVGVIGSGLEAETNLLATCTVREVERVKVFSPRAHRREGFARRMSETLGIEVDPVDEPQAAVADMDIVVIATNTGPGGPVAYQGEWAEPGQHISSIGSTTPQLREIDVPTFVRADLIVYDLAPAIMAEESGDVLAFSHADPANHERTLTLQDLLLDTSVAAPGQDTISLYKSVGAAVQDIACALAVYEQAIQLGVGQTVDPVAILKSFG